MIVGSSPLARGLLAGVAGRLTTARIIPARAGFTCGLIFRPHGLPDHPRSRGVYSRSRRSLRPQKGSSPLARGLRNPVPGQWQNVGIIPARAGFTRPPLFITHTTPDHPRSRGVYALAFGGVAKEAGSSPLARGLPAEGRRNGTPCGIIPARAGFTTHFQLA